MSDKLDSDMVAAREREKKEGAKVIKDRVKRAGDSKDDETEHRDMKPADKKVLLRRFDQMTGQMRADMYKDGKKVAKSLKKAAKKLSKAKEHLRAGEK